jgi:hypothetical protein
MDAANREMRELAERWRLAGLVLRRIDPAAFEALLHGAEVVIVETPEPAAEINFPDLMA